MTTRSGFGNPGGRLRVQIGMRENPDPGAGLFELRQSTGILRETDSLHGAVPELPPAQARGDAEFLAVQR